MESGQEFRFRLTLHYDGSDFHGWQLQPEVRTVQGELESALERLTGATRRVTGAGRTDRGVHATGQVAAVTLPARWDVVELHRAMNAVLPSDLWVEDVRKVNLEFHPRYDAVERSYAYRVGLADAVGSPFHRPWCWALCEPLERDALAGPADALSGEHSFRKFRKSGQPGRGDVCRVRSAAWEPWGDLGLAFRITANRYLHHMVRYLVGTMVEVARGRRPEDDFFELLEDPETELVTSPPAPPEGLFLTRVGYPEEAPAGTRPEDAGGGADGNGDTDILSTP